MKNRKLLSLACAAGVAVGGAGTASAGIPNIHTGVITACYTTGTRQAW